MMTKSELQSLKDFIRKEIHGQGFIILGLKDRSKSFYKQAEPGTTQGEASFRQLNKTRTSLKREKAVMARLVALQKSVKKALKNDA